MNDEDINFLQASINSILVAKGLPDIIVSSKPAVNLKEVSSMFNSNMCTIMVLYNEYRGRMSNQGPIGIQHIIVSLASSIEEMRELFKTASTSSLLKEYVSNDMIDIAIELFGERDNINLYSTPVMSVHEYILSLNMPRTSQGLRDTYNILKSTTTVSDKLLSFNAIIGGIKKAHPYIKEYDIFTYINSFDIIPDLGIMKIMDAISWYETQIVTDDMYINISFYYDALMKLKDIPILRDDANQPIVQMYKPMEQLMKIIVRTTYPLDIIDTISSAKTSPRVPMIIGTVNAEQKIIKGYNGAEKDISWFAKTEPNTLRMVIKGSNRLQIVDYDSIKGYFSTTTDSKSMSIPDIITEMCNHLGIDSLTVPIPISSTYSFYTNDIRGTGDIFGIDNNILAYMLTNPPPEYKNANLHKFVFVKDDSNPTSLKEHMYIHIQLGVHKMFLSISKEKTTMGTLSPDLYDSKKLIGFDQKQRFLDVRINKCPTIHHARICQTIYANLITMYIKYYEEYRSRIFQKTLIYEKPINPHIPKLIERVPKTIEYYKYHDSLLYNHASTLDPSLLAVPIPKSEVQDWISKSYAVMKLPTIVINNPKVQFETESEIWLRCPIPNRRFVLKKKPQSEYYIPMAYEGKMSDSLRVLVLSDYTLEEIYEESTSDKHILKENATLITKINRLGHLSLPCKKILSDIIPDTASLYRYGISMNVMHAMNINLVTRKNERDVAKYAYLCKQECWDQTVAEIENDILSKRIDPMKHYRALERAYGLSIFFMMDDPVEPYIRTPPHIYMHIQRISPFTDFIIFHSLSTHPNNYTLIVSELVGKLTFKFKGAAKMDQLLSKVNNIFMISPADNINMNITPTYVMEYIDEWKASEQVLDRYGKCRAITYYYKGNKQNGVVTINIGFASVQLLPIGDIYYPTMSRSKPLFIETIFNAKDKNVKSSANLFVDLVLYPTPKSQFIEHIQHEKSARVLRIVTHIIYSATDLTLDEFFENHIDVSSSYPDVYDTSLLKNRLPVIDTKDISKVWKYFKSILPNMIKQSLGNYMILIKDQKTRDALWLNMYSTPKIRWPTMFPSFVRYSWDINSYENETIYLKEIDLIQHMMLEQAPKFRSDIIPSPIPYILDRNGHKYLIQMARDIQHARYIIYIWDKKKTNEGYEGKSIPVNIEVPIVDYDFTYKVAESSIIEYAGNTYVLLPLD